MVVPSKENPPLNFNLQINPASKLKHAIESLSDIEFNQTGSALIEVGLDRFEITARNPKTHVTGYLCLKSTGLIEFHCVKPIKNKMIKLNHISQNLDCVDDQGIIRIYHIDGSNELCFSFGSPHTGEFAVKLLEIDEEFKKFPIITFACEAVILSEHLRQMISFMQQAPKPEIVSVDISERNVNISVGKQAWRYDYDLKRGGTRGMAPGQKHNAWFQWPHCESLKKASLVAVGFLLCIVTDPPTNIMLRFNLRELGDLVFIKEATMIFLNSQVKTQAPLGLGCLASVASLLS